MPKGKGTYGDQVGRPPKGKKYARGGQVGDNPRFGFPGAGQGQEGIDYDKTEAGAGGINIGGWHPTEEWEFQGGGETPTFDARNRKESVHGFMEGGGTPQATNQQYAEGGSVPQYGWGGNLWKKAKKALTKHGDALKAATTGALGQLGDIREGAVGALKKGVGKFGDLAEDAGDYAKGRVRKALTRPSQWREWKPGRQRGLGLGKAIAGLGQALTPSDHPSYDKFSSFSGSSLGDYFSGKDSDSWRDEGSGDPREEMIPSDSGSFGYKDGGTTKSSAIEGMKGMSIGRKLPHGKIKKKGLKYTDEQTPFKPGIKKYRDGEVQYGWDDKHFGSATKYKKPRTYGALNVEGPEDSSDVTVTSYSDVGPKKYHTKKKESGGSVKPTASSKRGNVFSRRLAKATKK